MTAFKDLAGQRYGRWLVLQRVQDRYGQTQWLCRCDCGTERSVASAKLTSGHSTSCGCRRVEVGRQMILQNRTGIRHGMHKHRVYAVWQAMKQRCTNPNTKQWKDYGGRGISVCDRWQIFDNFLEDMGIPKRGLTLDRINNDGGYEPGNCRWATRQEQQQNTRRSKRVEPGTQGGGG